VTAGTEEIGKAVIGEEGSTGLDGKQEVLTAGDRVHTGKEEGDDETWVKLKKGLGENGCGQRVIKSVKWAGWVWDGLSVIGQGRDMFKGEKVEMGSRNTGLGVGCRSIGDLPLSSADNLDDPKEDVAAMELIGESELLKEPKGCTPTWLPTLWDKILSCWGEDT